MKTRTRAYHVLQGTATQSTIIYDQERTFIFDIDAIEFVGADNQAELVSPDLLRRLRIIHDDDDNLSTSQPDSVDELAITDVSLDVAGECNMGCSYCFENDILARRGAMSIETLRSSLELVFSNARPRTVIDIHFGSGEPLTNMRRIRECVETANACAHRYKCSVVFDVTTNGTLIKDDIARFFSDHNFRVKVSLDGPYNMHDQKRPMLGGRSSYGLARRGFDILMNHLPAEMIGINTVLPYDAPLAELWTWVKKLGVGQWTTIPLGEKAVKIDPDLINKRRDDLSEIAGEIKSDLLSGTMITEYETITKVIKKLVMRTPTYRYCGAGGSFIGVRSDGAIYPCLRQLGIEDCRLGDARDGLCNEARKSYLCSVAARVDHRSACKKCWAKYLCGGGCYADSIVYGANKDAPLDSHCPFFRLEIETGIRLYSDLRRNSPVAVLRIIGKEAVSHFNELIEIQR